MNYRKLFAAALLAACSLLGAPSALVAQSFSSSQDFVGSDGGTGSGHSSVAPPPAPSAPAARPFSRIALGGGITPLGIQFSMSNNLNSHLNLRTSGNLFKYSTNFTASGISADAHLDMHSVGSSLDIYPTRWGFRISPGVLVYNGNQLRASASVPGGTSFTLNDQTYYTANANATSGATPVNGNALLNLHTTNPAFTVTTGW